MEALFSLIIFVIVIGWLNRGSGSTPKKSPTPQHQPNYDFINNQSEFYFELAEKKSEKGEHKGAVYIYTQAIRVKPKAKYYNNRAHSKSEMNDYNGAIEDYSRAIQLEPNGVRYWLNRGLTHSNNGKFELACPDFERATQLGSEQAKKLFELYCKQNNKRLTTNSVEQVASFSEILQFARHYFALGMNVTCISNQLNEHNFYCRNILKTPNHIWKHLFSQRQLQKEFEQYEWNTATGVGSVTGFQDLRVIDIDGCNDYDFLDEVLDFLDLPANYEWVTLSGSKNGFHIFINCNKFSYLEENQVVTTFPPKEGFKHIFEKIEILWNTHVVLPPSIHNSGSSYSFINCKCPKTLPQLVKHRKVSKFIDTYLEAEKKIIGRGYGEVLFEFIPPNIPSDLDEADLAQLENTTVICVLDIETDGLPNKNLDSVDYPNVVQVAWLLMDTDGNIFKKESELINYPNITYTEAFAVNNIDITLVKRIGKQPNEVYKKLISDIKISNFIVAHNIDFDLPILKSQLKKYQMQDPFNNKRTICTMKESINYCGIPNYDGRNKFPKLTELYKKLFDYDIEQKHNAESDTLLTAKCFRELLNKGIIDLDNY